MISQLFASPPPPMPQQPSRPSTPPPWRLATQEERQRVLTAFERGDDWLTVAKYNNMSRAPAYWLCKTGDPSPPARGGARASVVKCTDEIVKAMEGYLDAECTLTLTQLADKVLEEFAVELSTSTISAKLATKLVTLKQACIVKVLSSGRH
ncbi:hypothetical protein PI125_g3599 [Phytophthora idaei]|nr:hypothetical protein PI125_g3599 [Phytophthora idaei]KAG3149941.1 hypothetical protein PI126_g11763 [Phytophthora idaei]